MHDLRKAISADPYGKLVEKSHGHPVLDDIHTAFDELLEARQTVDTYRKLVDCLSGTVEGVKISMVMTVTGGKLDKEGMMAQVMEQNPGMAAMLERDPQMRAQAEAEMEQLIANDQNRMDRAFNIALDLNQGSAAKVLDALVPHLPNPHTLASGVSSILKEASLKVYDPDYKG